MSDIKIGDTSDKEVNTWAGAATVFFKEFFGVIALLIILGFFGQCVGIVDIYRLLGR